MYREPPAVTLRRLRSQRARNAKANATADILGAVAALRGYDNEQRRRMETDRTFDRRNMEADRSFERLQGRDARADMQADRTFSANEAHRAHSRGIMDARDERAQRRADTQQRTADNAAGLTTSQPFVETIARGGDFDMEMARYLGAVDRHGGTAQTEEEIRNRADALAAQYANDEAKAARLEKSRQISDSLTRARTRAANRSNRRTGGESGPSNKAALKGFDLGFREDARDARALEAKGRSLLADALKLPPPRIDVMLTEDQQKAAAAEHKRRQDALVAMGNDLIKQAQDMRVKHKAASFGHEGETRTEGASRRRQEIADLGPSPRFEPEPGFYDREGPTLPEPEIGPRLPPEAAAMTTESRPAPFVLEPTTITADKFVPQRWREKATGKTVIAYTPEDVRRLRAYKGSEYLGEVGQ